MIPKLNILNSSLERIVSTASGALVVGGVRDICIDGVVSGDRFECFKLFNGEGPDQTRPDQTRPDQTRPDVHQLFTSCSPDVHQLFTSCSPVVHQMFTSCSPDVHQLFTSCSPVVHQLFTSCSPLVHQLFTSCSPVVHQFLSTLDYPSYIFSVYFVFLNSLLFCVISTVQWSGATSICDGIISNNAPLLFLIFWHIIYGNARSNPCVKDYVADFV